MRRPSVVLDLASVASITQLHGLLSDALGFPNWYGKNWDAFWDAITGLVEMPARMQFIGWDAFEARFQDDAQILKNCLDEMSEQFPTIAAHVEYA